MIGRQVWPTALLYPIGARARSGLAVGVRSRWDGRTTVVGEGSAGVLWRAVSEVVVVGASQG